MAEPFIDEAPRPPTFVQIRPPARPGMVRRNVLLAAGGIVLIATVGWIVHRSGFDPAAVPVAQQAPLAVVGGQSLPVPPSVDAGLATLAFDVAVTTPLSGRETLMGWILPFDAAAPERQADPGAPSADTRDASHGRQYEVSVRLAKGDTIGTALQKLGFETAAIADAVAALAPHVRLKRLPIGLGLTLQVRPSANDEDKPVLQALTLEPEGRPITVERTDDGQYVVETPQR